MGALEMRYLIDEVSSELILRVGGPRRGPARGGGLRVRRGGAPLLCFVFFFAFCATGEAARGEGFGFASAFAGAPSSTISQSVRSCFMNFA